MMATALEHNGATVYIVGRRLAVLEQVAKERSVRSTSSLFSRSILIAIIGPFCSSYQLSELLTLQFLAPWKIDSSTMRCNLTRVARRARLDDPETARLHKSPGL